VGLGSAGLHRYLDAEEEAFAVLDGLRAAARLAEWQAVVSSGKMAVVGLSQGGQAVLSAAAWHSRYAPELDIRAFGASGPASVYEEHWRAAAGIPGSHLVMHAMLVWSFLEAAGQEDTGAWAESLAPTLDTQLTSLCTWSPNNTREKLLGDDFPTRPAEVFSAALLQEYTTGSWSQFSAVHDRFEANRVRPWSDQTAPVAIWQGSDDTTVLPSMTEALVGDLRAGGVEVELFLVEGGTHTTSAFGFLAVHEVAMEESIAWVKNHLEE
jgi:pimeloyl-ACP methyl ester carboxylesterase